MSQSFFYERVNTYIRVRLQMIPPGEDGPFSGSNPEARELVLTHNLSAASVKASIVDRTS